jgi:hypothetical protein
MTNDDGRAVAEVAVARTRAHLDPVFIFVPQHPHFIATAGTAATPQRFQLVTW